MTPGGGGASPLVVTCDWRGWDAPEELLGEREAAQAAQLSGPRRLEWVRTRLTAKAAVRWATGRGGAEILPDRQGAPRVLFPSIGASGPGASDSGATALGVSYEATPFGAAASGTIDHEAHQAHEATGYEATEYAATDHGATHQGPTLHGVSDCAATDRATTTPGVTVSLSHTGTLAVCAVSRDGRAGPLGVDIEPIEGANAILLPRLFGPGESPSVLGELSPGALATVLVTCKEAALKAHRRPSSSLRAYRLWRCDRGRLWVRTAGHRHGDLRLWRSCRAGRVLAVCGDGRRAPARRGVTPQDVLATVHGQVGPLEPRTHRRSER